MENAGIAGALEQMGAPVKPGGWLRFDSRNLENIQREGQRFYAYNSVFHGVDRVNMVQVWDHNADGSITFNPLCTFERDNRILQREVFKERYQPFAKGFAIQALDAPGYADVVLLQVPGKTGKTDYDKIDWYRIIARKHY